MPTDITRSTFDRTKHFSSVRKQQGRVDIDADFNELNDILNHQDRTTRIDVIGRAAGPEGNAGFLITPGGTGIMIGKGRYYVDGILVENEADVDFAQQPDFPAATIPPLSAGTDKYLFYLDVWERPITALEDPSIREVALGGPDHGTRTKVIAQVKALPVNGACSDFGKEWAENLADPNVCMQARAVPTDDDTDPCKVPASAGYRSLENQLYRVEIFDAGALGVATFTWSRENASVATEWTDPSGAVLPVTSSGRDANLGFKNGDWVELNCESRVLQGKRGVLIKLKQVEDRSLEVDFAFKALPADIAAAAPATLSALLAFFTGKRTVRRWESDSTTALFTVEIPTGDQDYQDLENGVQVRFSNGTNVDEHGLTRPSVFRTGDHWLIPARVNGATVEWPKVGSLQKAMPPVGIAHHYARLALATAAAGIEANQIDWTIDSDCRCLFPPLCDLPDDCCCCEITVGDGKTSHGDFNDIQAAVNEAARRNQEHAGLHHICLLPGVFDLGSTTATAEIAERAVTITGLRVMISGCKGRTTVVAVANEPAFVAIRCPQFEMYDLEIEASCERGAVLTASCKEVHLHHLSIVNADRTRPEGQPLVRPIKKLFQQGTGPAVFMDGDAVAQLDNNRLIGTPALHLTVLDAMVKDNLAAGGGLHCNMTEGSQYLVERNRIEHGMGPGVVLSTATDPEGGLLSKPGHSLARVNENVIRSMSSGGIVSSTKGNADQAGITRLGQVHITHNLIESCGATQFEDGLDGFGTGGIILANADELSISNNRITECGFGTIAASGIQVFRSRAVTITHNVIENNGILIPVTEEKTGIQAGIAALFITSPVASAAAGENEKLFVPSGAALVVHGNQVTTPSGPALWVMAVGPVSVQDNSFLSRAECRQLYDKATYRLDKETWALSLKGAVVSILDLGLAAEIPEPAKQEEVAAYLEAFGMRYTEDIPTSVPSGAVLCDNNQSHLSCEAVINGKRGLPNTFIISIDDVRLQGGVQRSVLPREVMQLVANRVFAFTAGVNGGRMQEGRDGVTQASGLLVAGWLNMTDNVATHCLWGASPHPVVGENSIMIGAGTKCDSLWADITEPYLLKTAHDEVAKQLSALTSWNAMVGNPPLEEVLRKFILRPIFDIMNS